VNNAHARTTLGAPPGGHVQRDRDRALTHAGRRRTRASKHAETLTYASFDNGSHLPHYRSMRSLRRAGAGILAVIAATVALAGCSADGTSPPQPTAQVVVAFQWMQSEVQPIGWTAQTHDVVPPAESDDPSLSPCQDADVADADLIVDLGGFKPVAYEAVGLDATGEALDVSQFVPQLAVPPCGGRSPPPSW
jgi:hypothetical protein